jgi:Na+-transporting NADH:ubiquinone oxidoreductase subunit C
MIALGLCVICSVFISSAAVVLKPYQVANQLLDRNKNVLIAAGIFDSAINTDADVPRLFAEFTPRIADISGGRFLSDDELADLGINPVTYDARAVINQPGFSDQLSRLDDVASIQRRVRYPTVYLMEKADGDIEIIVLPISGYGLWGIMHGYLALDGDANTIIGVGFYDHKETPGLGGEISNPRWRALWPGKKVYDESGDVALGVVKGAGEGPHEIDGLAGATLTSRGVDNMIEFWMGDRGFGPLLENISQDR